MSNNAFAYLLFLVFFAGGLSGIIIASITTRSDMQKEAIKADVAEWETNPKTGETKFTWIKGEK